MIDELNVQASVFPMVCGKLLDGVNDEDHRPGIRVEMAIRRLW